MPKKDPRLPVNVTTASNRPPHAGALDTADLTVGRIVFHRFSLGEGEPYVTRLKILGTPDRRRIHVEDLGEVGGSRRPMTTIRYLSDMGVEPDEDGNWNQLNHVTAE